MISGPPGLTMTSRNVTRARTKTQTLSLPAQAVRPNENRTGNWSRGKRIRPDVDETCILIDGKAIAGAPCATPALQPYKSGRQVMS